MTDPAPLQVTLLGNDPADEQWSMLNYGTQLQKALIAVLRDPQRVTLISPDTRRSGRWLRHWRIGRGAATYWSRYLRYPPLLKRLEKPENFHILDHGNGWLIRYLDPQRTVITCHDLIPLIFRNHRDSIFPWISNIAYQQVLAGLTQAAKILANSSCTRDDLVRHLKIPADRIHVVPLGIDEIFRPPTDPQQALAARASLGLPWETLLLHVGQNVFYKNLEGLLKILRILLDRKESVWLVRAGPLFNSRQRQLAQRLQVTNRLIELGPLPPEKLRLLYQAADLLVYPSWYEGLGLPPLEAMASGLPVVVSNRGALPETVGDAGLVADPDEPSRFADAIQRLTHDFSLRARFISSGLARAAKFRWETAALETLRIYRSDLGLPYS